MLKKSVFLIVALVIILSLSACGSSPEKAMPTSAASCTEPAEVVFINPDPALLNNDVTIHVAGSSKGLVIRDTLIGVTIVDSTGKIIKQYGWKRLSFPNGLPISSGNGWKWVDRFDAGEPGRWKITVEYLNYLGDSKTIQGSFCLNEGATSVPEITGDVVKPPSYGVEVPKLIDVKTFKKKYSIEKILPKNFISINGNGVANPEVDERGDIVEFDGGVAFVLVGHDWRPGDGVGVGKFQGMAVLTYQNNKPILSYGIFYHVADRVKIELKDLGVGGGKFNFIVTMEDTTTPEGKPYPLHLRSYDLVLYSFDGTRLKKLFFSENWGGSGPYSIGDSDKDGALDIVGDRLFAEWTGKGFGDSSESTYVEEIEE